MDKEKAEKNAYEVVDVGSDATEAEIKKAYRQRSLKTHPDRNPHLKDAARLFHELTQAYELLLDPVRRMALDAKLRIQQARTQRYANYDKKRKDMVEELEEAERAAAAAKSAEAKKKQKYAQEAEQIRDAGRRMVEERQAELRRQQEEVERAEKSAQEELEPPPLGEHDTTVRVKYMLARYPQLTTPGALQTFMSSTFGPVDGDSIVLSMKSPKKKVIAAVPFKTISDAHAAVCASRRVDRGLDEFEITWMIGSEPAVWSWAERMLKSKENEKAQRGAATTTTTTVPTMSAPAGGARDVGDDAPTGFPASIGNNARGGLPKDSGAQSSPATSAQQFSSFPSSFPVLSPPASSTPQFSAPGLDFESAVLMRMRQAERERLEREIREQEASET
ncbi:hypothetical protein BGY98DRAFT_957576 [Russula aff. rugulosa BPL654]|nr:hypothetical protein BGY98DRAFT_957576 [Russula aff. rugulosa BPL654]